VVDRFPLNDMGKVRRDELAKLAKEKDDGDDAPAHAALPVVGPSLWS
jgi:hypothetical protein